MAEADKMSVQAQSYGRKRAKTACTTCRVLKRKCSGRYPCSMCVQYEYECRFEGKPRGSSKLSPSEDESSASKSRTSRDRSVVSSGAMDADSQYQILARANAGLNFPQALFTKLDSRAPQIRPYAWNLGLSFASAQPQPVTLRTLQDLMDRKDINRFINRYFESFHIMYGFLDEQDLRLRLAGRMRESTTRGDIFDAVLCGAIALGMAFSGPSSLKQELNLVSHANSILSADSLFPRPSIEDAEAWLLRAFYMRVAGSHYAAWIASCTSLQVMEAVGLDKEPIDDDPRAEQKRKLFWMSRVLNTWTSYDTAHSVFELRGATCLPPPPSSMDDQPGTKNFADLYDLYEASKVLNPISEEQPDLESTLKKIALVSPQHDELVLSQSNLTLCVFRRLRLARAQPPAHLLEQIINSLRNGLDAAGRLIEAKQPWWHVVGVPLQFVCVMITIDTPQSLSHIGHGIRTLQQAAAQFNTPVTQGVLNIVSHLVRLSYEKKQEESAHLFGTLSTRSPALGQSAEEPSPQRSDTAPTTMYDMPELPVGDLTSMPPPFGTELSDYMDSGMPEFWPFSNEQGPFTSRAP